MADISTLKINERANENEIYIKGQYENRQNCEWCRISNKRTISKFSDFWNSDNFPN